MINYVDDLKKLAIQEGADLFGAADLQQYHDDITLEFDPFVAGFLYSISIGIYLMNSLVDQIVNKDDITAIFSYNRHAYDVVNQRLDLITSKLSSRLQEQGYRSMPVAASLTVDPHKQRGQFSHKLGAHLAGLGWIGKSCLLITPQKGPRVRWASILTDAPLAVQNHPLESRCGACMECIKICPAGAISGHMYHQGEPRELRLDVQKCEAYREAHANEMGITVYCGLCLYACPHGRRHSKAS